MRRSRKETIVLDPHNRLLHNGVPDSIGMGGQRFAAEASQEWASGPSHVRNAPHKPFLP
ncbi:hypothetical protein [Paenibacillus flagellatus]|uniref:hypothetical protein n=1 Tax=Paenibacillus flagellatus TaxID=2211139 RepID=UPI0013051145|nr:hypothetical protein [Paenibacillus flagellatus]